MNRSSVDPATIEVEIVPNMEAQYLANDHVISDFAHGDDLMDPAFHRDRRAGHSRRPHDDARRLLQSNLNELVRLWRKLKRRLVHLMRLLKRDHVRHELASVADVDESV